MLVFDKTYFPDSFKKKLTLKPGTNEKALDLIPNTANHDFSNDMYIPINVAKGNWDFIDFGINHTDLRIKPHIKRRFIWMETTQNTSQSS